MSKGKEPISIDGEKGELRIFGRRHLAMDAEGLCAHLDQLVGQRVAEVVIKQHEYRLGKEEAELVRKENPTTDLAAIIRIFEASERVSGVGIVRVNFLQEGNSPKPPFQVEIANPCVKATAGAAKSLISSYLCGVMSHLVGGELEAEGLGYDESKNVLTFGIVMRK